MSIVASISTIPNRLISLTTVLTSLLNQTTLPTFLYISLAKYYPRSKKNYPVDDLSSLQTFLSSYPIPNKLIIYENDIGPCIKLITPLKNHTFNKDDLIFTLDDDTPIYERTIECLLQSYLKNKDAVYSFSGTRENRFFHAELLPENFDYFVIDIVGGYRGVLYPTYLINNAEFYNWVDMFITYAHKKGLTAMHDDHIFSYYFKYKNIPRRVSNCPFNKNFTYTPIKNDDGIFNDPLSENSINTLRETLYDKELNWVIDNLF